MISDFPVIVDACVLVQAAVRDTLLRLFERRLFLARWTDEIIEETVRTLRDNLGRTQEQTDHLVNELRNHFPDAWVEHGYRELIPAMTNQEKDRHVLAAAVKNTLRGDRDIQPEGFPRGISQTLRNYGETSRRILDRPLPPQWRDGGPRTSSTGNSVAKPSHDQRSVGLSRNVQVRAVCATDSRKAKPVKKSATRLARLPTSE